MSRQSSRRVKVAIDLTPMQPGGENGGAKRLVLTLLGEFSRRRSDQFEYLIITDEWNHDESLEFSSENITCLSRDEIFSGSIKTKRYSWNLGLIKLNFASIWGKFRHSIGKYIQKIELKLITLDLCLNSSEILFWKTLSRLIKLVSFYLSFMSELLCRSKVLQLEQGVELLFCPFSSPSFAEKDLPLVAVVYDLQHLDMPQFFSLRERANRSRFLEKLLNKGNQIICISNFTQESYIHYFKANPQQILSVPVCIHERLEHQSQQKVDSTLNKLGIGGKSYLFFPANFWPHKNHRTLLEAYKIYQDSHVNDAADLVFTGALKSGQKVIESLVSQLGLSSNIHFMGFLTESDLIAVWQGCQGLIFPSLYEGFGIPLLEAMWFKKPVACSRVGSLPEIGGDAVIYFDPTKPAEISQAMACITHNQVLIADLITRGTKQLKNFNQSAMADQYMDIFMSALDNR